MTTYREVKRAKCPRWWCWGRLHPITGDTYLCSNCNTEYQKVTK